MIDIVLASGLDAPKGLSLIDGNKERRLKTSSPASVKADARMRGVLLYSPPYEIEEGACVELARNGGALVFSLSDVLREGGFRRSIIISKMRLALAACRRAGCSSVAFTLAKRQEEVRTGRELAAFMAVLGMTDAERKHAKEIAETLAKKEGAG